MLIAFLASPVPGASPTARIAGGNRNGWDMEGRDGKAKGQHLLRRVAHRPRRRALEVPLLPYQGRYQETGHTQLRGSGKARRATEGRGNPKGARQRGPQGGAPPRHHRRRHACARVPRALYQVARVRLRNRTDHRRKLSTMCETDFPVPQSGKGGRNHGRHNPTDASGAPRGRSLQQHGRKGPPIPQAGNAVCGGQRNHRSDPLHTPRATAQAGDERAKCARSRGP